MKNQEPSVGESHPAESTGAHELYCNLDKDHHGPCLYVASKCGAAPSAVTPPATQDDCTCANVHTDLPCDVHGEAAAPDWVEKAHDLARQAYRIACGHLPEFIQGGEEAQDKIEALIVAALRSYVPAVTKETLCGTAAADILMGTDSLHTVKAAVTSAELPSRPQKIATVSNASKLDAALNQPEPEVEVQSDGSCIPVPWEDCGQGNHIPGPGCADCRDAARPGGESMMNGGNMQNGWINKVLEIEGKRGKAIAQQRALDIYRSLVLGRNFNETVENYFKRNPVIGEFAQWVEEYTA